MFFLMIRVSTDEIRLVMEANKCFCLGVWMLLFICKVLILILFSCWCKC